jgi:hypothetical protein
MFTSASDPTITGMFLLVAILAALEEYAQRLERVEYRVGLVATEHRLREAETAANRPRRGKGRPKGSLNRPKTLWTNGVAAL